MAANYDLSKPIEKRVRFFDGQFLQDQDFVDEQKYHLDRSRRHNRQLHLSGIVEGLTVTKGANNQVTVAPGTAIDSDGRQLVLVETRQADLVPADKFNDKQGIQLYIRYRESAVDQQTGTGSADNTRWLESPELVLLAPGESLSSGMPPVLLAQLALDNKGVVTVDNSVRQYSGLRLPGPAVDAPTVRTTANGRVNLSSTLTVEGSLAIGATDPGSAKLKIVNTANDFADVVFSGSGMGQLQVIGWKDGWNINTKNDGKHLFLNRDALENSDVWIGRDGKEVAIKGSTGHMGIGTTTVDNPNGWNRVLDILGTGNARLLVRSSGGVKTTVNSHDTWDGAVGVVGTDTNHALRLMTNSAHRLTVDTSGNVGIGTISPDSRLTINGNITHDNNYNTYGDAPLTIFEPTHNGGSTPAALRDILNLVREGVSAQAYGNKASFALGRYEHNSTNARTQLDIKLTDSSFNVHTAVLSLRSNGNVGVGVTSPASRLHVDNGRVDITTSNDSAGGQNRFTGLLAWDASTAYRRGQLVLSSSYSDLVIASSKANNNHGSTLTFVTSDPSDATKYRKWVINQGNWGTRKQFLDFGYADADSRANPHDNINSTDTVLTLDGVNKRLGIGQITPRTGLDMGTGVMSGAPNDYQKAQFTMSGGGTVTWGGPGNRLKWSARFIAISMERGKSFSAGHVNIAQPTTNIPKENVYDGTARSVTADGVVLKAWEALYAVHTVGGNEAAVSGFQICAYTQDFYAPSNWLLVAVVNGDDNTVKLGTGAIISANSSSAYGNALPSGVILMWSGAVNQVPGGWALCDGGNGTPNLKDRFIVGAGASYGVGATGGEALHALTVNEMPSHNHNNGVFNKLLKSDGQYTMKDWDSTNNEPNLLAWGDITPAGGNQAHENRPPYYALAYIMKL